MGTHTLSLAEDRGLQIQPGARVFTGYVPLHRVRLGCRDRMAVGDVDRAYQRRLQLAPNQPWPPPVGTWEEEMVEGSGSGSGGGSSRDGRWFVIEDGRHEYVAALMLGCESILVAWVVAAEDIKQEYTKPMQTPESTMSEQTSISLWPYPLGGKYRPPAPDACVAPWPDFEGGEIRDGDRLLHPDGDSENSDGVVVFCDADQGALSVDRWMVLYRDGVVLPLVLQIGEKGRGVVWHQS